MLNAFTLQQYLQAGLGAIIVALITAFFARRQATEVAVQQAGAAVEVKRLENDDSTEGRLYARISELEKTIETVRGQLTECERRANVAQTTAAVLQSQHEQKLKDTQELNDFVMRQLLQKLESASTIEDGHFSPQLLRQLADSIERDQSQRPPGAPPVAPPIALPAPDDPLLL